MPTLRQCLRIPSFSLRQYFRDAPDRKARRCFFADLADSIESIRARHRSPTLPAESLPDLRQMGEEDLIVGGFCILVTVLDPPSSPPLTPEQCAAVLRSKATIEHEPQSGWDLYLHLGSEYGVRYRMRADGQGAYVTSQHKVFRIRGDPSVICIVQIRQFPWQYVKRLEDARELISIVMGLCHKSTIILAEERRLNSRTWCFLVLMKLWECDQPADKHIPPDEVARVQALLQRILQDVVSSWVRRVAGRMGPGPAMCPVAFWRLDSWPWTAYYGVPSGWTDLHQRSHH
ncbi:hypothetical protein GGS23DRAFT_512849 [Durotheca rogersii]|uniref:uncharacterized protein n=1 Tax=Durotheca rogersii TaxID=419775 RepID=UPI00221EAC63|nr:uncharacterized protein GGS23DRAFT_512849 [Durotheca rogersii]KAI5863751.1 hypothetical protein GGS23DRAFT_512849 [Durotheca rogersii]